MIRYAMKCGDDHAFDAWFASGEAYDTLRRKGQVNCPDCGSPDVEKAMMSPRVSGGDITAPEKRRRSPLEGLKRYVERTADYVGSDFATRARAMHDGSEPHRPIYGEALMSDACKLVADGVPIAPLPFLPKAKVN